MRITIATFSAAAMLFAISSSLPEPARQGEKSELDHGDTTHPRRLISRGSKERRDQVYCSGRTMYGDTLASDIANATAQADGACVGDGEAPPYDPSYWTVNNIEVYWCNNNYAGCIDKGLLPGYIAQVQAQCGGANKGGWYSYDSPWTFGLDPAGFSQCDA